MSEIRKENLISKLRGAYAKHGGESIQNRISKFIQHPLKPIVQKYRADSKNVELSFLFNIENYLTLCHCGFNMSSEIS